jgi:hypothetical protein
MRSRFRRLSALRGRHRSHDVTDVDVDAGQRTLEDGRRRKRRCPRDPKNVADPKAKTPPSDPIKK